MKDVVVVGPGAMGLLFAVRLCEAGITVRLLDYKRKRAESIVRSGITLRERDGTRKHFTIPCGWDPRVEEPAQLLLLSVKAYDTENAVRRSIGLLAPGGVVVSLQNGIRHVSVIRSFLSPSQTVFGTTGQAATLIKTGCVRHCGSGETLVAQEGENAGAVQSVVSLFSRAGIPASIVSDLSYMLWRKLLFNAAINPVTAIVGIRNGRLAQIPEAWKSACLCFREAREVAASLIGSHLAQVTEEDLREVCERTAENTSSMLQDIRRGKRTEIDAINGVVVEEALKGGKKAPVNEVLVNLVTALCKARR